jgi:hypothetical protein
MRCLAVVSVAVVACVLGALLMNQRDKTVYGPCMSAGSSIGNFTADLCKFNASRHFYCIHYVCNSLRELPGYEMPPSCERIGDHISAFLGMGDLITNLSRPWRGDTYASWTACNALVHQSCIHRGLLWEAVDHILEHTNDSMNANLAPLHALVNTTLHEARQNRETFLGYLASLRTDQQVTLAVTVLTAVVVLAMTPCCCRQPIVITVRSAKKKKAKVPVPVDTKSVSTSAATAPVDPSSFVAAVKAVLTDQAPPNGRNAAAVVAAPARRSQRKQKPARPDEQPGAAVPA